MLMDLIRPLDGRSLIESLDDRWAARKGLFTHAHFRAEPGGTNPGGGGGDPPADLPADPLVSDPGLGDGDSAEVNQKLLEQKRRANAEAKTAKDALIEANKRLETLEAEAEARRQTEMSDLEKAQDATKKLQEQIDELKGKITKKDTAATKADRMRIVASAGVQSKDMQEFIADKLAVAQTADGEDLKVDEWVEKYRTDNPQFFGESVAPPTGGGHPRPRGSNSTVEAEIGRLEAELKEKEGMGLLTTAQKAAMYHRIELLKGGHDDHVH